MRQLLAGILAKPGLLVEVLLSSMLISILGLAGSVYSIMILRRYVGSGVDATLLTLTSGVLLALVFENLLRSARFQILMDYLARKEVTDSARTLAGFTLNQYEALADMPITRRREAMTASQQMQQAYSASNLAAVLDVPFALIYLAVLSLACLPVGVLTSFAVLVSFGISLIGIRLLRPLAESGSTQTAQFASLNNFLLSGNETLRMFSVLTPFRHQWDELFLQSQSQKQKVQTLQSGLQQAGGIVASLLSIGTYAVGAIQVVRGQLDIGTLIGLSILSSRCFQTCNRLTSMLDSLARAKRANAALSDLDGLQKEPLRGSAVPEYKGGLELLSLTIRYPDQPLAIVENLTFKLQSGTILGISGPNGSGKTSLLRVLTGLRSPTEGLIKADGIELRQILPEWWRSQIAYVPQDLSFFDGSIRENLVTRNPQITDEQLLSLCQSCDLMGYLTQKQGGLQFQIKNNGLELPMGIRRRLALARALVAPAVLMLLDEPTEGLDVSGIQALMQILKQKKESGTTIVIASNESYLANVCDGMVALEAGSGFKLLKKEASKT